MKRRDFLLTIAAGVTPALSGCLTRRLLEDVPVTETHTYAETVSAFLITLDGKKLVVLGDSYHYVFDAPRSLIQTLQAPFHPLVSANVSRFIVTNNEVSGPYELVLDPKAGDEHKAAAGRIGFKPDTDGSMILRDTLSGTRYSAEGFSTAAVKNKFNKPYRVDVSERWTSGGGPSPKMLLTPVTLAADGVLLLGGVVALTLILLAMCAGSSQKGCRLWS